MITHHDATGEDLSHIARHLRKQDRVEVEAATGKSAERVLFDSWRSSKGTWIARVDGVPACLYGIAAHDSFEGFGVPWMVGTDEMLRHQRALIFDAKKWVEKMQAQYPTLINATHARNTAAIRWLRWLGFQFTPEVTVNGHPFIPFYRTQQHV